MRWIVLFIAVVAAGGAAWLVWRMRVPAMPVPATQAGAPSPLPPLSGVQASDDEAVRLGQRMRDDERVANDVVFLLMAALRGLCDPALAHDLPRMAVLARVPVLSAGGAAESPGFRRDVSHVVNELAHRAPCHRTLAIRVGAYAVSLAPATYAEAFPDSYFDPGLAPVPSEFKGAPLAERVADACTRVAYATLPLDEPRAWQCAGLRAGARRNILAVCRSEGARPDDAAAGIQHLLGSLPATCQ
jgi:hypothetical protein